MNQATKKAKDLVYLMAYGCRFILCCLLTEFILHLVHPVAIKDAKAWGSLSAAELGSLGMINLIVIWLKLLLIWRFFRFWALADGIETQENMLRCVLNNYSGLMFWRSWHASFNKWIIR
jgi:D-alanyl-lipoteichoic acid acyltransferase DltB (MBOAT superfamily)